MRRLRIVFFSDIFTPYVSGVVTSIANFSRELIARGHTVYLFTSKYEESGEHAVPGLNVIKLKPSRFFSNYPGFTTIALSNYGAVMKKLREIKPDLIHTQMPTPAAWFNYLYAKKLGVPWVNTFHTVLPDIGEYIFVTRFIGKSLAHKGVDWWQRTYFNLNTAVVAPSESAKRELLRMGVRVPIEVISNGIDLNQFRPPPHGRPDHTGPVRFVFAGRVSNEKNIDVVVCAFALVQPKLPGSTLSIVGGGPEQQALERLATQLDVGQHVHFSGHMPYKDMAKQYAAHDVLVTASMIETEGLTILEAMACGLPVIGVNVLNIPFIVRHGVNGFIAPPKDPAALAAHMETLGKDRSLIKQMGAHAMDVAKDYSLQRSTDVFEAFYRRLVLSNEETTDKEK